MRGATVALAVALVISGCLFGPTIECDDTDWEARLTCEGVIAAARVQLAGSPGITKLTAQQGLHCPSVGGCPYAPDAATVYADRADGGRLFVDVYIDKEGRLRAERPQAVDEVRDR